MSREYAMNKEVKGLYVHLLLVGCAFVVLYFQVISELIKDWDTNANFSHGYFIPFISCAMIYSRRAKFVDVKLDPSLWGLLLLVFGLVQYLVASVGLEFFLQRSSMLVVLFGVVLFLGGKSFGNIVAYPICYLLLMIPLPAIIWNSIAFPMQLFASAAAEIVVRLLGITVYREGNILNLAATSLEVVDACSGLRSLTAMLALGLALVYFSKLSLAKRGGILLSVFPIAILVNVFRLSVTAVMANSFGAEMAQGFLHDFSGWLTFVMGLALLWGVAELLAERK